MNIVEMSQLVYGTENTGRSHPLYMEYQVNTSTGVMATIMHIIKICAETN